MPGEARCPSCGVWPEMVRGSWWPHAPGAPCGAQHLAAAIVTAVNAALDGCALCDPANGAHAFQAGAARCDCGQEAADDGEAAFDADTASERGVTSCGGGLHVFPPGGGACKCGSDFLAFAPPPRKANLPWYLEP